MHRQFPVDHEPVPLPAVSRLDVVVRSLLVPVAVLCLGVWAEAAPEKTPDQSETAPAASVAKQGLPPLQEAGDVVEPFVPKVPPTVEEKNRTESTGWYMTGRLLEARNDFTGALSAYKKAAELNPRAIEVYRSLIPLAYSLNQANEALKYALIAIEIDPDDYELMHRLSAQLAAEQKIPDAIGILEKALQSKRLTRDSSDFVNINRDLAFLYEQTQQIDLAADRYEIVFDALTNPLKYHLDSEERDILLKDALQTYEHIGDVFLKAERTELAIAAFEKAGEASGNKPSNLHYNLAMVYRQTQQPEKALAELQKYIDAQLQSKGNDAYQLFADLLADLDRSDELIPQLEATLEKDPYNQPLQHFLAAQYVETGKLAEAEALYKKSIKDGTSESAAFAGLAGVYRRQNKPDELLEVLSKAIQSREGLETLQAELTEIAKEPALLDSLFAAGLEAAKAEEPTLDFGGALILAELSTEAKRTSAAIDFYRFAIEARSDRAALLYDKLATYLIEAEEFGEAAKVLEDAVDDPSLANVRPNFQYQLSRALELDGQTDAAISAIQEAQKESDHPLLVFQEGWIQYHARQWDKAIPVFEKVIAKFPDGKNLPEDQKRILRASQMSLSNIYVQQGDIRKGEEVLERVYADDPNDISVNNDLGYLYADQDKNLEQAEKMIRKAVESDPDNAAYLDSLGWVLYKLEKYDEALPPLEKAVSLPGGGDATIWEHLGDCQAKLGKTDAARESWQKALDDAKAATHPDEEIIKRLEEKLAPAAN